jgi:hypothetical protein
VNDLWHFYSDYDFYGINQVDFSFFCLIFDLEGMKNAIHTHKRRLEAIYERRF